MVVLVILVATIVVVQVHLPSTINDSSGHAEKETDAAGSSEKSVQYCLQSSKIFDRIFLSLTTQASHDTRQRAGLYPRWRCDDVIMMSLLGAT